MGGDGRINVNAGGLRFEAAGSDKVIDRNFSSPAGFTTDWIRAGNTSIVAHKKTSAVEEGGGEPSSGNTANAPAFCAVHTADASEEFKC
jgi:hypothetical protein